MVHTLVSTIEHIRIVVRYLILCNKSLKKNEPEMWAEKKQSGN